MRRPKLDIGLAFRPDPTLVGVGNFSLFRRNRLQIFRLLRAGAEAARVGFQAPRPGPPTCLPLLRARSLATTRRLLGHRRASTRPVDRPTRAADVLARFPPRDPRLPCLPLDSGISAASKRPRRPRPPSELVQHASERSSRQLRRSPHRPGPPCLPASDSDPLPAQPCRLAR